MGGNSSDFLEKTVFITSSG